ncbi:MAG: hypothetical protein POH28_14485 [Acidocella sp.]|nr:hypothetical protein [Acidocella sp.]
MSLSINMSINNLAFATSSATYGVSGASAGLAGNAGGSAGSNGFGGGGGSSRPAGDTRSVVAMADGASVSVLRGPAGDVLSVTTMPAGGGVGGGVDVMA